MKNLFCQLIQLARNFASSILNDFYKVKLRPPISYKDNVVFLKYTIKIINQDILVKL